MISGDEEIVRVMFLARANASLTDIEERAPIHLAAERGYTKYRLKFLKLIFH